jgi:hypothetical protein
MPPLLVTCSWEKCCAWCAKAGVYGDAELSSAKTPEEREEDGFIYFNGDRSKGDNEDRYDAASGGDARRCASLQTTSRRIL